MERYYNRFPDGPPAGRTDEFVSSNSFQRNDAHCTNQGKNWYIGYCHCVFFLALCTSMACLPL